MRRFLSLFLSALGWVGFVVVTGWTMVFLADVVLARTVDGPARTGTLPAVATDVGLLLLFGVQHSVMARRGFKRWLARWVPVDLERTVFVLATDVVLVVLLVGWQPFGGPVWQITGPVVPVVWAVTATGWVLAIAATFAVDHLELTGLRGGGWFAGTAVRADRLHVGGLHAVVRHPLMTGLLVAVWATPHLGASHLLFAVGSTGYILLGTRFEERDLRRTFGAAYDDYAARVPALVPALVPVLVPGARRRAGRGSAHT